MRLARRVGPVAVVALALGVLAGGPGASGARSAPTCEGEPATIVGTNGSDTGNDAIEGTNGPDVIVARGGGDEISGKGATT